MDFDEAYRREKAIDLDLLQVEALELVSPKIVNLIQDQLLKGQTSKGSLIIPSYASKSYSLRKYKQNKKPGLWTPDLFKEGNMFREMDVVIGIPNDKEYSIISYVPYFNKLQKKYKKAFGLQEQNDSKTGATDKLIELYNAKTGI